MWLLRPSTTLRAGLRRRATLPLLRRCCQPRCLSSVPTPVVDIIAKKREGAELSAEEVHSFVERFTAGEVADYQMTSLFISLAVGAVGMYAVGDKGLTWDRSAGLLLIGAGGFLALRD